MKPVILTILDGYGYRKEKEGNAVALANTPVFDALWQKYPHTFLQASSNEVGLPKGQMGNSEVGHANLGAGRIAYQPLERINQSIEDQSFFQNEEIKNVLRHVKENHSKLHIMGLISDGGVHSHIDHLMALIDLCYQEQIPELYLHLFTDGRDTDPKSAYSYISQVEEKLKKLEHGRIATVGGRYYAMDRDNNYDRLKKSYDTIVYGQNFVQESVEEYINQSYQKGVTDEFLLPATFDPDGILADNDGLIVFNFRKDRLREMLTAITNPLFHEMEVKQFTNLKVVTMFPVTESVKASSAFMDFDYKNTLGEYISNHHGRQLRIAETEKYAHVTFFFDGGKEIDYPNEKKILIPSPKVATYDLKPEMSAYEITDALLQEMDQFDLIILNYANGDMVGHTGILPAAIKAVETLDHCLEKVYQKAQEIGMTMVVTADHGNCEEMINEQGNRVTSHTTNLVPFFITRDDIKLTQEVGKLADVAPTILKLMDLEIPKEMTGTSLIEETK